MESLENLVWGNRVCNYSALVALTFTVHDWISTTDEELNQIWRRPWTNLKALYVFLRFLSVGTQLFPVIISLRPSSTSLAPTSIQDCHAIVGFPGAASQVLMMAVQAILLLRVGALYQRKAFLQLTLRALYVAEIITMTVIFIIAMPQVEYGIHCVVTYFPPKYSTSFFLLPIMIEFLLFVLTMVKFYEAVRDGWARQRLIFRFLQDGVWAFALPFVILTINTACMALLPGSLSSIAYSWVIAFTGFAGCRLILNMSHLLRSHAEGPSTYPEQDFQIDTQLLSHQHATTSAYEM